MKMLHPLSFLLVVVGALNWGLMGLLDYNLVNALLGSSATLERLVYILVGLSAVYLVATHKNTCVLCGAGNGKSSKK